MGRTAARLAADGVTAAAGTAVTATYGPTGAEYVATACAVSTPNTAITCTSAPGVGVNHLWSVQVASGAPGAVPITVLSGVLTGYLPPAISVVERVDAASAGNVLPTDGGAWMWVNGTNFGPAGGALSVTYGPTGTEYTSPACTMVVPHRALRCAAAPGIGGRLVFRVAVGLSQLGVSAPFNGTSLRYATPVVLSLNGTAALDTRGRQAIVVNGANLGPLGTVGIAVTYAVVNTSVPLYTAVNCHVTVAHAQVVCDSVAGVGASLAVTLTVGGQASAPSADTVAYLLPVITGISGLGADGAVTEGGQQVILAGDMFGPTTTTSVPLPDGVVAAFDLWPQARYGRLAAGATPATLKYAAVSCQVTVAHRQMVCLTAPGTGAELYWAATVGGQSSDIFLNATTNYHPPVVAFYSGPGAEDADTRGYEVVYIDGKNFGPAGSVVENATYGWHGVEFSTNCTIVTPHSRLLCTTVVGAGTGHSWLIVIDGQVSVAPTTGYAPPEVTGFSGPGAVDASTDGGQAVVIEGRYFSEARYLNKVTYGPSGTEFTAARCAITVPHARITCYTVPGTGRRLHWIVTVGAQESAPSVITTSYAPPVILAVVPANGPTSGGTAVRIIGTNFALAFPLAAIRIKMNTDGGQAPPDDASRAAYWADAVAGGADPASAVGRWVSGLTTVHESNRLLLAGGNHSMEIALPEGWGKSRELFVVVDEVPSNIMTFKYDPPKILNVAPDRNEVPGGFLRVFLEGTSFCSGRGGCGTLYVDGAPMTPRNYSHTVIVFPVQQPTGNARVRAYVVVDGVPSNTVEFRNPVPSFDGQVGQVPWDNMDTAGGEAFFVARVSDIGTVPVDQIRVEIGGRNCTNVTRTIDSDTSAAYGIAPDSPAAEQYRTHRLSCLSPAGVGLGNLIILKVPGGQSAANTGFVFNYGAPVVLDVVDPNDEQWSYTHPLRALGQPVNGVPTLGTRVRLLGRNFGDASLGSVAAALVSVSGVQTAVPLVQTDTVVEVMLPPWQGWGIPLVYLVGGQTSMDVPTAGPSAGVSPAATLLRFKAPTVSTVVPQLASTVGGVNVTITGTNFGVFGTNAPTPSSMPLVFVGGRGCALTSGNTGANHTELECTLPAGQGANLSVLVSVSGQNTSALTSGAYSYATPRVFAVAPASGPTSGRTMDGVPINVTLTGINFGLLGATRIVLRQLDPNEHLPDFEVPQGNIVAQNHTSITFQLPEGGGEFLSVQVIVGGQASADIVPFTYLPPSVTSFHRADKVAWECYDRVAHIELDDGRVMNRTVSADCYRTRGGYQLEIVGESFGIPAFGSSVGVSIGARVCVPQYYSHNRIICMVPQGLGDSNAIVVMVGRRYSQVTNATIFAYDAPFIDSIIPNVPDATGIETLRIRGYNFGYEATPLALQLGGKPCEVAEWSNDAQLNCKPEADTVGPKNVSVLVANRTQPYVWYAEERKVIFQCRKDFSGLVDEWCINCETELVGAVCPGGELEVDLMTSDVGFWREDIPTPDPKCHPLRQGRAKCPTFLPCEPTWSCLGNNTCAEGYTDFRCSHCIKGKYYRVNGECVKCPNSPWMIFIMFMLGGLVACGVAWILNRKRISLALISIGVDYFQVLSMFARVRIRWPAFLKELFQLMSAFAFNIDLAAPECIMPDLSYATKWAAIEVLPMLAVSLFGVLYTARLAWNVCVRRVKREDRHAHLPQLVSTIIVVYRVLFLYLTRTSMDIFYCAPTDPPEADGTMYMSGMLDVPCWKSGSLQMFLMPFAIGTLGFYTLGLPVAAVTFLRRRRAIVVYDQLLRASGTGDDRWTNRHVAFRRMWHNLYHHMAPAKYLFEFVILARKGLLAFVSLMFRSSASYQLGATTLVLFVAYVFHVLNTPYLTHNNRSAVLAEHERLALTDPVHANIAADIRAYARQNKVGMNLRRSNSFSTVAATARRSRGDTAVLNTFDYNTVEAVLLACAVLVSLAGVMFDSNRFTGANAHYYQSEYNGLAAATASLIAASIIFYLIAFVYDLLIVCAPNSAMVVTTCFSRTFKAQGAGVRNRRASAARAAGKVATVLRGSAASDVDDPLATGLSANPLLMAGGVVAGGSGAARTAARSEVADVAAMVAPPTPEQWVHIRSNYAALASTVDDLTSQLRSAKRLAGLMLDSPDDDGAAGALATARTDGTPAADAVAPRMRTQFTPRRSIALASDGDRSALALAAGLLGGGGAAAKASAPRLAAPRLAGGEGGVEGSNPLRLKSLASGLGSAKTPRAARDGSAVAVTPTVAAEPAVAAATHGDPEPATVSASSSTGGGGGGGSGGGLTGAISDGEVPEIHNPLSAGSAPASSSTARPRTPRVAAAGGDDATPRRMRMQYAPQRNDAGRGPAAASSAASGLRLGSVRAASSTRPAVVTAGGAGDSDGMTSSANPLRAAAAAPAALATTTAPTGGGGGGEPGDLPTTMTNPLAASRVAP